MAWDKVHISTANIPAKVKQELLQELRVLFPELTHGDVYLFSASPPAIVEIVAALATWQNVLKVAAVAFLTGYGKRAGEIAADKSAAQLRNFVATFRNLADKLGRPPVVRLKVPGPGVHITTLTLSGLSAREPHVAMVQVAAVTAHLPAIQQAIGDLDPKETRHAVECEVRPDSFTLRWVRRLDSQVYAWTFDADGNPTGPAERQPKAR